MMRAALGFGAIQDDDELLDRLGERRASFDSDDLEGLLSAWTAQIDADERACAREVGPLGLRGVVESAPATVTRVVRVPRRRAVALVGALALTVSGGGVAAALNQVDLPGVRVLAQMSRGVPVMAPTAQGSASPTTGAVEALPAMIDKARSAYATGQVDKARGLIEAIRMLTPNGGAPDRIVAEVDRLEREIDAFSPAGQAAPSNQSQVDVPTLPLGVADTADRPPTANSPTPTTVPSLVASAPGTASPRPSDKGSSPADTPTATQTPTTPAETTRPEGPTTGPGTATSSPSDTLGGASGEQRPGTSSPTQPQRPEPTKPSEATATAPSGTATATSGTTSPDSQARPTGTAPEASTTGEASAAEAVSEPGDVVTGDSAEDPTAR